MSNLYILTEERPKEDVIKQILNVFSKEYGNNISSTDILINPIFNEGRFIDEYEVEGVQVEGINKIYLKIASGNSSFVDFLVFEQENAPKEKSINNENDGNNLIFLIEETKTSDKESRNTGVYQRMSKFVYADYFYPNVKKYMLYNIDQPDDIKQPSGTSIFGTNMLLTQGVEIIGKSLKFFKPFKSVDELIRYKNGMRRPPKGNVPMILTLKDDTIYISGRLEKPKGKGNIGHDPNVGALTAISKTLRDLGWKGNIVITEHGVSQSYLDKIRSNKFLSIASMVGIELDGVSFNVNKFIPKQYWHYEHNSEKVGTIFLQMLATSKNDSVISIYENHAGCERGYFYTQTRKALALPKKDKNGVNLYLPDLILKNDETKEILLIEGKQSSTLDKGLEEIKHFESIEDEFIKPYYRDYSIERWIVTYGRDIYHKNLNPKVIFHLNKNGTYYVNENAPIWIKELFD